MLTEVIDKRIKALEDICDELPLLVTDKPWSAYALGLLEKMQRIAAILSDRTDDVNFDGTMADAFKDAWVTTENGHKVHFNENGEPDKGNQNVLELIKGAVDKSETEQEVRKKHPRKHMDSRCEYPVRYENAGAVTKSKDGRVITHFNHDEETMKLTKPIRVQDRTGQIYKVMVGEIKHLTVFAAKEVGRGLDVADKLARQLGGSADSWKHSKGIAKVKGRDGKQFEADIHWFESPEVGQVGWKLKLPVEEMDESQIYWEK